MQITIRDCIKLANIELQKTQTDWTATDINLLLCHVMSMSGVEELFIHHNQILSIDQYTSFITKLELLKNDVPVNLIIGEKFFYGRAFHINNHCLIPRWDSEQLVKLVVDYYKYSDVHKACKKDDKIINILDLCSGSGCLGISTAMELKYQTKLSMYDISTEAMEMALINAKKFSIDAETIVGDIFCDMTKQLTNKKFDIILFNPPYIRTDEIQYLQKKVSKYENHIALDGGNDGLKFYRYIADKLSLILNQNSILALEHGYDQSENVAQIFQEKQYKIITKEQYHMILSL